MGLRRVAAGCCAAAGLVQVAAGQDGVALLQQGSVENAGTSAAFLGQELSRFIEEGRGKKITDMSRKLVGLMDDVAPQAADADMMRSLKEVGQSYKGALAKGWKAFHEMSRHSTNANPQELLHNAKVALLETGAMSEMRQLARATANASRTMTQGAVPLDSMKIGFRTSVAPWNNVLKMFSIPLIKASFSLFSNFFGPDGNAARLCVSAAVAADSTYGVHTHAEFGGINIFIGPAKWDNVPGWAFGTSGGVDNVRILDVADFGWVWTLSREPETVCFMYDICVIDDEALHSNLLQTGSEVEKAATIPRHGSTWVEHVWCSPDWENTPLVLPDDTSGSTMDEETGKDADGKPYFKTEEEWDPESEAV